MTGLGSCALAIFAKTPGCSPVKTRLAAATGREVAEELYIASAMAVASVVDRAQAKAGLRAYWALAEPESVGSQVWPIFGHLYQGEGALGVRMGAIYRRLRQSYRGVILIGTDAPQIDSLQLANAAAWLSGSGEKFVLGRADDGGFWLFGGNAEVEDAAWTRPEYSRTDTAERFVDAIGNDRAWLELETLRDMDCVGDLLQVAAELGALPTLTPEQQRMRIQVEQVCKAMAVQS